MSSCPLYTGLNHMHYSLMRKMKVRVIVFNATFNNSSVILWWSLLLVEETGVPGENCETALYRQ